LEIKKPDEGENTTGSFQISDRTTEESKQNSTHKIKRFRFARILIGRK
jgi:hypothetical protein